MKYPFTYCVTATIAAGLLFSTAALSQSKPKSIDAMIAEIESKSNRYARLEPFLNSDDPSVRRAAFETATQSGDPLLRARVLQESLLSADTPLRVAALRELLFSRPNFILELQPNDGGEEAINYSTARGNQIAFGVAAKHPDLNCLSLAYSACDETRSLSVEGLRVNIVYGNFRGTFELSDEGSLVGKITDERLNDTIPSVIRLF